MHFFLAKITVNFTITNAHLPTTIREQKTARKYKYKYIHWSNMVKVMFVTVRAVMCAHFMSFNVHFKIKFKL